MTGSRLLSAAGLLAMVAWFLAWGVVGGTIEPEPQILTGELWQGMSRDAKVAFVLGVGNLAEFERAQGDGETEGQVIPHLRRGLAGKPINEVIRQVDAHYEANPGELKRPVVEAVLRAVAPPKSRP
jgi:hypothetical protein